MYFQLEISQLSWEIIDKFPNLLKIKGGGGWVKKIYTLWSCLKTYFRWDECAGQLRVNTQVLVGSLEREFKNIKLVVLEGGDSKLKIDLRTKQVFLLIK